MLWGECMESYPAIKQPAALELLFHRSSRQPYLLASPCSAQMAPPLPREVKREVCIFSGCAGKGERQKHQWQGRGGCFTSPASSQRSGRLCTRQGCTELAARCYIHTVSYTWRVRLPPWISVKKMHLCKASKDAPTNGDIIDSWNKKKNLPCLDQHNIIQWKRWKTV